MAHAILLMTFLSLGYADITWCYSFFSVKPVDSTQKGNPYDQYQPYGIYFVYSVFQI